MHSYTIHKNGKNEGPFTAEQARAGLADGTFAGSDLAWRPGLAQWAPLDRRLAEDSGEAPPPVPPAIHPQAGPGATSAQKSGVGTGVIIAVVLGIGALVSIVILGLLAALAIPAFKKVRNNAIEKMMLNDARQISEAFKQKCAEENKETVTVKEVRELIPQLSKGVLFGRIEETQGGYGIIQLTYENGGADIVTLKPVGKFALVNAEYLRRLSSKPTLSKQAAPDEHTIIFDVETGRPVE